jgi:hypothetical protein
MNVLTDPVWANRINGSRLLIPKLGELVEITIKR